MLPLLLFSYAAGKVLTVTMTGAPTVITIGTVAGAQFPLTITDSAGITNATFDAWNIAGSTDKTIDQSLLASDLVAPTITAASAPVNATGAGAVTVVFTLSEPVRCAPGTATLAAQNTACAAQFIYSPTGAAYTNGTAITLSADGKTATVSFTTALPVASATDMYGYFAGANPIQDYASNNLPNVTAPTATTNP